MSLNPRLIKESFAYIEPVADQAAAYFYGRVFAESPQLRAAFPPAMNVQQGRLFQALTRIVWSLDNPEELAPYLQQLGRSHRKYGVTPEGYAALGRALIATIRRFAAEIWTEEMEAAWVAAYTTASGLMIAAADENALVSPPLWYAEVIGHELRTRDIAVITLRPSHHLPFVPGQYVEVQTARWPRVWRQFSIANAPRPDNTIQLHVKAIPGGWVSTALVRHTRIGDTVTLGAPVGTLPLPQDTGRGFLLLAGGTGLAPLKSIAEYLISLGRRSAINLLYGARTAAELYDLPDLMRMQSGYPWLSVLPVVSDQPDYDGLQGRLCDVIGRIPALPDHEIYVSGPNDMIRETLRSLDRYGVPPTQIHHDLGAALSLPVRQPR